ncbi:N-acetyl-gamma-glutamyl-phosphate reductase [Erythrobacter sp. Dej080120_24]|uniref:N-acetyl-gamma-glutamyl-phosphate reductase n=1 Tax=Erythrobacter sp. Dej080120_24 TaxID=3024837 RepID=UPI0030C6DAE8
MAVRVFIDGAAGTTGLEIRDRLKGRDEFELLVLPDDQRKNAKARKDALHAADIAILCLPDDAARETVALAEGSQVRIIDASSAHRVAEGWTYGFPEIIGHSRIRKVRLVSNPGCYPTGFIALLAPLVDEGLLRSDWPFTVNAVSGYSGGGNALIDRFEADKTLAFRAYGLALGHKHLAEMTRYSGLRHAPVFSPAVVPAYRGMVIDIPVPGQAFAGDTGAGNLHEVLEAAYESSRVVRVHDCADNPSEIILNADAPASDALDLYVFGEGQEARLVAVLDNLGKGASGAAIQNLNIMCGIAETTGLRL